MKTAPRDEGAPALYQTVLATRSLRARSQSSELRNKYCQARALLSTPLTSLQVSNKLSLLSLHPFFDFQHTSVHTQLKSPCSPESQVRIFRLWLSLKSLYSATQVDNLHIKTSLTLMKLDNFLLHLLFIFFSSGSEL